MTEFGTQGADSAAARSTAPDPVEQDLARFREQERARLGLAAANEGWFDANPRHFAKAERGSTTLLFGGLTTAHDLLIEAALGGLGYRAKALPYPDTEALQCGKEFGNRGQCNPTYFTVGNLVRYLMRLRDEQGIPVSDIIRDNVFVTISSCGPCRFGTYITEYRKALRDAGLAGFRVIDIKQEEGPGSVAEEAGIEISRRLYMTFLKCLMIGDLLNIMGYRTRPYELEPGATDRAIAQSTEILARAFAGRTSIMRALRRCRSLFGTIRVDRMQPKPKVAIIGEFWAMTTEGEGNYRLQRFLEAEGAECEIQLVTAWLFYNIWCFQYDIRERMMLRRSESERHRSEFARPGRALVMLAVARWLVGLMFRRYARTIGLENYRLPSMDELAETAHRFYPNQLRGGEGHLEVGKVIQAVAQKKAHMVLSVKPFGCMPSSAVSDGIQSLVAARWPDTNFLPIETTGDGAVNVYSRVQMALFKARARAAQEYRDALAARGLDPDEARRRAGRRSRLTRAVHYPRHISAGTAANAVFELG